MNLFLPNIARFISSKHAFVEAHLQEDSITFNLLVTSTRKKQMLVEEKFIDIRSLEELQGHISDSVPVHLILTGNGIISRIFHLSEENQEDIKAILLGKFPNINPSEVNYSIYETGKTGIISIIRKSKLDELIKEFSQFLKISDVTIGGSDIVKIAEYSGQNDLEISFRKKNYHFLQTQIIKIQDTDLNCKSIQIGNETVEAEVFIPFGRALRHYDNSNNILTDQAFDLKNLKWQEDFTFQMLFGHLWKSALGFLFLILLGNYFVFNYTSKINNNYSNEIISLESNNDKLKENKQKSVKLKTLLAKYGFSNQKMIAVEMNELTNAIPDGMNFTEVVFHPNVKSRNKRISKFDKKRILLRGRVSNINMLNNYIKEIQQLPWINHLEIMRLEDNDRLNQLMFSIEINRNN